MTIEEKKQRTQAHYGNNPAPNNSKRRNRRRELIENGGLSKQTQPNDFVPGYNASEPAMTRKAQRKDTVLCFEDDGVARKSNSGLIGICAIIVPCFVLLVSMLPTGVFDMSSMTFHDFAWWRETLLENVSAFANYVTGISDGNGIEFVFWRYCTAAVAGAGLAACGAVSQGTLKNYLASPSTLGIVSGATLGAVLYVVFFEFSTDASFVTATEYQARLSAMSSIEYALATAGRQLFSFAGCFIVVVFVLGVSYLAGRGKLSKIALIVIGQIVAMVTAAVVSLIRYWVTYEGTEEQLRLVTQLSNGVFSNTITPIDFATVAVPVCVCLLLFLISARRMNALSFSDEEARSMGMSVSRARAVSMLLCALTTAIIVSFCGAIGFVGFMVPHFMRRIVGADFKWLLPASMVGGALFLVFVYFVMLLGNFFNGALGAACTVVGALVFVIVLVLQRRSGNAAWN